ncbi:MAG TPA: fumarylacetoacetate hydrolase family protein [Solirubrobacteraceae bacterium]|nr:fumarylacetoacetate hydrolase family protein [Solirubrobacteraceae bacterium]
MRLVTFDRDAGPEAGVVSGERIVPASALGAPASARELLATHAGDALRELAGRASPAGAQAEAVALEGARLCAPVPDPQKIICIGLNYRDHAAETGQEIPAAPMWFAKFANSLCGSGAPVLLPRAHAEYVDYEAELALVIGREAYEVSVEDASSHIAGAMPFNDVSARDLQLQNPLWTSGKAIDTFAPCGPALVTLDEIDDLGNLSLQTRVNGETLQRGTTANLIFGPAELVAWLSRTMTLLPGDIIATGTPAGVGVAQGRFLRDGDTVEVEIEGLGTLTSPIRAA